MEEKQREYIIPMNDKNKKNYTFGYKGSKFIVTQVENKKTGNYCIVPGYVKSDPYEFGLNKAIKIKEIDDEETSSLIRKVLKKNNFKGPINFW
ncbi:MAG TPA: hypothetical protein VJ912_04115 [Candidatus Nanoarchaeia archaeon]|nr:hypothetical protein [Candidatus Nanoarchaeia archaeon]